MRTWSRAFGRFCLCAGMFLGLAIVPFINGTAHAGLLKQLALEDTPIGSDLPLDHFMSYKAKFKSIDDPKGKFNKFGPVVLTTQFGGAKFEISKPKAIMLPADKNGEGILDPDTHLKEYQIKRMTKLSDGSKQPKFTKLSDIRIANQCNSLLLELSKEDTMLVPTGKQVASFDDPLDPNQQNVPGLPSGVVDHFLCYKAKVQTKLADGTKLPKFPKGTQVDVTDQFQTRRYDLKKITKLCAPTEKEEDPNDPILLLAGSNKGDPKSITEAWVNNPRDHLVCYQAKPAKKDIPQDGCGCDTVLDEKCKGVTIDPKQPKHVAQSGFLNNQFGPESFEKTKENELCIPSLKNELGSHKCVVGGGSSIAISTEGFPIPPLVASGSIDIECGEVDSGTGKAPCSCNIQDFDPVVITAIGTACINPASSACESGEIDCDGGNGLDVTVTSDHNIGACTGNGDCSSQCDTYCGGISAVQTSSGCEGFCLGGASDGSPCTMDTDCPGGSCVGGDGAPHGNVCGCHCNEVGGAPSAAGSLNCNLGANIFVVLPAGSPCTDPPTISLGDSCIPLTTTSATGTVLNANNGAGTFGQGPLVGTALDCDAFAESVTTGGVMVGVVNFYDSTLGDLSVALTTECQ